MWQNVMWDGGLKEGGARLIGELVLSSCLSSTAAVFESG